MLFLGGKFYKNNYLYIYKLGKINPLTITGYRFGIYIGERKFGYLNGLVKDRYNSPACIKKWHDFFSLHHWVLFDHQDAPIFLIIKR
jgi:hypothetical protein